jgi:GrpB-like predicted nucleotidyltransferase (UPF0157 family)
MARMIEVLPYDPTWPMIYRAEVVQVATVLGSNVVAAHHIGSTAVPGLAAKPTIDILLVVRELETLDGCNSTLWQTSVIKRRENMAFWDGGISPRRRATGTCSISMPTPRTCGHHPAFEFS